MPQLPMLDASQMQHFEDDGAVIVDLQLPKDVLDGAEAAWERDVSPMWDDPDWIALMADPCFEEIAKQVLRSDRVYILETGRAAPGTDRGETNERAKSNDWPEKHGIRSECTPPSPTTPPPPTASLRPPRLTAVLGAPGANAMHTDVQVTTEDFEATPRREHLAIWFWLNDVPAERAAMRVSLGSHKRLGAHWQEMQRRWAEDPSAPLPVMHGPRWEAEGEPDARWWAGEEPTAMAAKRGHAQVFSQSLLHAGWHSESEVPRKGMHVSWVAEGVSIGGMAFNDNAGRIDGVRERSRALRERLPADRRHIAMDDATLDRLVAAWVEEWPPTLRGRFRL